MSRRPKFDACSATLAKLAQAPKPNRQGYMSIVLGPTKMRYYFCLIANVLFAFEDITKAKLVGCICIEACLVKNQGAGATDFTLTTMGNTMWTFSAEDDSTDSWLLEIRQHCNNTSDLSGAGNVAERLKTMHEQMVKLEQENMALRKLSSEYEQAAKKIVGFKEKAKKDLNSLKRQLEAKEQEAVVREDALAKARAEVEKANARLAEAQDANFLQRKKNGGGRASSRSSFFACFGN
jgi:hypothetical protein